MIIKLGTPTRAEVIDSVLGQLSDGIWENSGAMDKYWKFADVDGTNLDISDEMYSGGYDYYRNPTRNGFYGKSEKEIKDWFANKAKQVVKIWAEDYGKNPKTIWDRNNTEDTVAYMGGHKVRDISVADVYECYDFLKGRSGKKYGAKPVEEPIKAPINKPYEVVDNVVEPKVSGGMNPSQQDVEDFFLDASTRTKGRSIKANRRTFTKHPSNKVYAAKEYIKSYVTSEPLLVSANGNFTLVIVGGVGVQDTPYTDFEIQRSKLANEAVVDIDIHRSRGSFDGLPVISVPSKMEGEYATATYGFGSRYRTNDWIKDTFIAVLSEAVSFCEELDNYFSSTGREQLAEMCKDVFLDMGIDYDSYVQQEADSYL